MTHCTPCIPVSSDNVALGLVAADESHCRVWGVWPSRAESGGGGDGWWLNGNAFIREEWEERQDLWRVGTAC